jgi:hypothetical protein
VPRQTLESLPLGKPLKCMFANMKSRQNRQR